MNSRRPLVAAMAIILLAATVATSTGPRRPATLEPLTYAELVELSDSEAPPAGLAAKLDGLLTTPVVDNGAWQSGVRPIKPSSPALGRFLRVALWNIERGLEIRGVIAALQGPRAFDRYVDRTKHPRRSRSRAEILEQARLLYDADVVVVNEADWGVPRTGYRNVAAELAAALRMNYAFGAEFVEVDPITLGTETFEEAAPEQRKVLLRNNTVDKTRMKGLHGTVILSRYRLDNVRLVRFTNACYDWYAGEKASVTKVEEGKRVASERALLEKISREVRRGGRMMLLADIEDPELPGGKTTIVATHLENKCKPSCRVEQMRELLALVAGIAHPVVVAGDMNTTGSDATPTSIGREVKKRLGSGEWWAGQAVTSFLGIGLGVKLLGSGATAVRKKGDPTVRSIPIFSSNPEAKIFDTLEAFRFVDGGAFDFRGDRGRTADGRAGTLANSNERAVKGFETTFEVEQTYGPIGKLKLDWIFVKPFRLTDPQDSKQPYRFAPHFGRTYLELNTATRERLSDHCALTVDLPFEEPKIGVNAR
jgi:endonuclease/exonuclease/phosphatase family metal-dependent hydrolase